MQATPASNETRLPRQVLQRSAAITERLKARESEADPAADPTPPAQPSADAAPPAAPTPATPAPDPRESDPAYWKQRFKATEGVLRVERDERVAAERLLKQQVAELQDQIRTLQASAPPSEIDTSQFLTAEQIETLGEEEAAAIVRAALKVAQAEARKIVDVEIKPLRDQREAEAAANVKSARERFLDGLIELVPNYDEIDKSEGWLRYLAQEVDVEGVGSVRRQVLLDQNVSAANVKNVAAMFQAYLKSQERPAPPVAPRGTGAVSSGEEPSPATAGLIGLTSAEIKEFFKRAATGKVTDQERKTFELRRKLPRR
jgi:hypothetical protein